MFAVIRAIADHPKSTDPIAPTAVSSGTGTVFRPDALLPRLAPIAMSTPAIDIRLVAIQDHVRAARSAITGRVRREIVNQRGHVEFFLAGQEIDRRSAQISGLHWGIGA